MSRLDTMLSYLPLYERTSQVIVSILTPGATEVDQLRTSIEDVLAQMYIDTATAWGLDLWEQMLGLKSYAGKPLDQRRSRIISKLRGIGTVTVLLIKNVAEAYDGGTVEVTEQPDLYQFTIEFIDTIGIPPNINDLMAAVEEIKPAHLEVIYTYKYNIHNVLAAYTHDYLAGFTHEQVRSSPL